MKKRFIIQIQSFSDVITNSSSELFVVKKRKRTAEELENMLENYKNEHNDYAYSGMGGELSVREFSATEHVNETVDWFFREVGFGSSHYDREKNEWVNDEIITEERKKEIIDYKKLQEFIFERCKAKGLPKEGFIIDIDNCSKKTIEFIEKDLGGVRYE